MDHTILGPGFAIEIKGIDLSQKLTPTAVRKMRDLWLEHKVAVFRGQELDDEDLIRFAEYFGPTYVYVRDQFNDQERPAITVISNIQEDGRKLGDLGDGEVHWHTDQAYSMEGSFGTILYGIEIPEDGGATCYGDLAQAYEAMPEELKARIADKNVTYSIARAAETQKLGLPEEQRRAKPPLSHPLVRTHPYIGRKALYISPNHALHVDGMDAEESLKLLEEVHGYATRPEAVYCHEWRRGDLVIHDNTSTIHRRDPFPVNQRRLLRRTGFLLPKEERARF
ncbi:MAG: Alpha-ketoglutarate-dependent 2,4-dichlorophenoxyacetate dioxygenase [Alphaproteobacteria bacterium MarineAlpha4_Bin2]|nr:MAG: Alpha-ketoglutarate-dependent 2,4-dichlorophenoxyacetate dioxygenase [Alphaproteobacteria bacterium MarineAlpha4_Bin2]